MGTGTANDGILQFPYLWEKRWATMRNGEKQRVLMHSWCSLDVVRPHRSWCGLVAVWMRSGCNLAWCSLWVSYLISLNPLLFKNIAHVGSLMYLVFVFVFVFVKVFVKCNAMTLFVYIYSLLDRILKLIYMGRLSSWMSLSLSSYLSLCVSLSVSSRGHHWIVRVMSFRNTYFMWVAMLK